MLCAISPPAGHLADPHRKTVWEHKVSEVAVIGYWLVWALPVIKTFCPCPLTCSLTFPWKHCWVAEFSLTGNWEHAISYIQQNSQILRTNKQKRTLNSNIYGVSRPLYTFPDKRPINLCSNIPRTRASSFASGAVASTWRVYMKVILNWNRFPWDSCSTWRSRV